MGDERQRIYEFLKRHPDRAYTEREIAHYLHLPVDVVLRECLVLEADGVIYEEDDGR